MKLSEVIFTNQWPTERKLGSSLLFIIDEVLKNQVPEALLKSKHVYWVQSGETLKNIHLFPQHVENLVDLCKDLDLSALKVVAIGGGSVGDFAGFFASIYRRGVGLIHIPSTWLAAMDSAHGGKTALNLGLAKNQIGSFYSAEKVVLVKPLLLRQPSERLQDALGEALKMAIIDRKVFTRFSKMKIWNDKAAWSVLPEIIKAKYRVVQKDPFEKKGLRQTLNLGHTLGHIFEIQHRLSHGYSVLLGTLFALEMSEAFGFLKTSSRRQIEKLPLWPDHYFADLLKLMRRTTERESLLKMDKKSDSSIQIRFVFIAGPGKTIVKSVLQQRVFQFWDEMLS
ncbi:MAG: 3-dehydroquinate synthase [Proteobacteria bacterium]|jgi:3-dehydroquinate synthase|nr:3-dehydroquinate synthase [Pseudomonadota bacterium]